MIGIGTTLNQRFRLDNELGRGGMGAVYRATDQVLQRSVAIKVLKEAAGEEVSRRIRLEAQILARLLHENVVRLYDFGESEGVYFLVMEEVDGSSLSKRWRQIPLAERLRINAQVADALNYAHHQGVIHRDVKPANVLLTATDQSKLSDFGLSMLAENKDESGVIRGTPQYMSPEQARGKRVDYRTDLYSLGVMLYEFATGAIPFQGQPMAMIAQHSSAMPTPPRFKNPEVSPSLESLILSLMAKNPEERPISGDVVAQLLRQEAEQEILRNPDQIETVKLTSVKPAPSISRPFEVLETAPTPSAPSSESSPAKPEAPGSTPISTPPAPALQRILTPTPAAVSSSALKVASPLARQILEDVLSAPISLSADERYLCGHYLAYLLGGSRRKGFFLRRPLDPINADRARLLLAMSWLGTVGANGENIAKSAELLDKRIEIRPSLNPIIVMKYLASRDNLARRKRFRQTRKQVQDASKYAQAHMLDENGVLNPGLMPQTFADLAKIAPARDEVDDLLVARWNRVAEVWRDNKAFRQATLQYATKSAHRDPASPDLWPEVVYPLIERARWQREFRPKHEAVWDYLCAKVLHVPAAGVRLDRVMVTAVPAQVVEVLDEELAHFIDDPRLDDEDAPPAGESRPEDRLIDGAVSLSELAADGASRDKKLVTLNPPSPYRFTTSDLRDLWREAMASLGKPVNTGQRTAAPVGPYRLVVIPSIRGRSAGQVALQGMRNKQIELLTPSIRASSSSNKPVIAVWVYHDASAVVVYLDFRATEKYILWHAPNSQQFNYEDLGELNHMLFTLGMEVPDQLDRVLSKRYRPPSPV